MELLLNISELNFQPILSYQESLEISPSYRVVNKHIIFELVVKETPPISSS